MISDSTVSNLSIVPPNVNQYDNFLDFSVFIRFSSYLWFYVSTRMFFATGDFPEAHLIIQYYTIERESKKKRAGY